MITDRLDGTPDVHPVILNARFEAALWTGACGDSEAAVTQFNSLLDHVSESLGPDHSLVLDCRSCLSQLTGQGDGPQQPYRDSWMRLPIGDGGQPNNPVNDGDIGSGRDTDSTESYP
ncbi:hypothetical protein [Streptomyces sp. GESEQ-35]|uniref:hypothetical protein n=1 Tax=Streptomyces sp. GESEQ-35 TaxID=2812657 RepID=UPI001B331609|nr:hypothetical protein [Streptomyces sp. GESEQ-35]